MARATAVRLHPLSLHVRLHRGLAQTRETGLRPAKARGLDRVPGIPSRQLHRGRVIEGGQRREPAIQAAAGGMR